MAGKARYVSKGLAFMDLCVTLWSWDIVRCRINVDLVGGAVNPSFKAWVNGDGFCNALAIKIL